ncbi:MAG: cysteine peptidase family C39 domain-containing protein [Polyangiales bacterium]
MTVREHAARTRLQSWVRVSCVARTLLTLGLLMAASACNVYAGSATTLKTTELRDEPGWLWVDGVPELRQEHELDCGPTALAMVLGYHAAEKPERVLAALPAEQRSQVTELRDLAKRYGFNAFIVEGKPEDLVYELKNKRPVIVGVAKPTVKSAVAHYEVVVGMHRDSQRVATLDPAVGLRQNSFTGFLSEWQGSGRVLLVVIPKAKPTPEATAGAAASQP